MKSATKGSDGALHKTEADLSCSQELRQNPDFKKKEYFRIAKGDSQAQIVLLTMY